MSLPSTQRKLHRKEFAKFYIDLCHLNHSNPLQVVKQSLDRGVLDVVGDRIKFDEWYPIVSALRWDQTLHRVAIRLRLRVQAPLMEADTELKARNATKQPALTTKFVLYWLLEALQKCLSQSPSLITLELDGLPIRDNFVSMLAQGVLEARCLQHLTLSKCGLRDVGVEVICMAVRNAPTITTLDLSYCDLTEVGAMAVAKLISFQKLNRYSEAWKQTLRYRDPDVEAMSGLRRLTLNHNPEIGNVGIELMVEEIRDDIWLRALDLQDIGISDTGALHLVQLVRSNPNLAIVDARDNSAMSEHCLSEILAVLAINNADKSESDYKWLSCNGNSSTDGKKSNSRPLRPWGSSTNSRCSGVNSRPSIPSLSAHSYSRSHSSLTQKDLLTWELKNKVQNRENEALRRRVQELNEILNLEVKQKSEVVKENQYLKEALEKCQLEKKQVEEEFAQKTTISEETLVVLEETLSRWAAMCSNSDQVFEKGGNEIPELLSNMKAVLNKDQVNNDQHSVQLHLKPIKAENGRRIKNRKRHNMKEQVIWEEEEDLKSGRMCNINKKKTAQEILANILKTNSVGSRRYSVKNRNDTSSEEASS